MFFFLYTTTAEPKPRCSLHTGRPASLPRTIFASGLRSEYFNPPGSTLAESEYQHSQRRTRNSHPVDPSAQRSRLRMRVGSLRALLETVVGIGQHRLLWSTSSCQRAACVPSFLIAPTYVWSHVQRQVMTSTSYLRDASRRACTNRTVTVPSPDI